MSLAATDGWAILPPARPRLANLDRRELVSLTAEVAAQQQAGVAALRARVPQLRVDLDPITGGPAMVSVPGEFLTGPGGQGRTVSSAARAAQAVDDPDAAAKAFLSEHREVFGFGPEALTAARVQRQFTSAHNGLRSIVWHQQVDGIAVFEGVLIAHTTRAGELVNLSSRFVRAPETAASRGTPARASAVAAPVIEAADAVERAAQNVGEQTGAGQVTAAGQVETGPEQGQRFTAPFLKGEAQVRLTWLPLDAQRLRLCWDVMLTSRMRGEMFRILVDATSGEVLLRHGLTEYLTDATYYVYTNDSPTPFSPGYSTPSTTQPAVVDRTLITLPALGTNASPLGWITDGVNETLGNNVDAHTDRTDDDVPDLPRPQGSPYRVFNFFIDVTAQDPTNYSQAAVVQLFYRCNWMHDRLYQLGFTEAAGNFQNNNFGRGGLGNDALQADAQDGGGTDNANMSTPPDGTAPRMQMYIFTGPSPRRDGDLDSEVVMHEYTHGLSNRRVGGGVGISALQTEGMGEGWSDWYALTLLSEPGDDVDGCYPSGAFASYLLEPGFTQNYYFGIRRYPFTTDLTKNPLTFKDIDPGQASPHTGIPRSPVVGTTANEVHNMGEVWCVALWEMRAALIHKLGYAVGNELALQLVTDGMNLSPVNPNFVQARDAILQADLVDDAGTNRNALWAAFAKRGLGASATAPFSASTSGVVEAFDVPDVLQIVPSVLNASGQVGGPFSPNPVSCTLTNLGLAPITWSLTSTSTWFTVAPASGALLPGGPTATVSVTIGAAANSLPLGVYASVLWFTNELSGAVQARTFNLSVVGRNMFDDFEPGIDLSQWSAFGGVVGSTVLATNYGGSVSGANSLWFGDAGTRFATTMPINTASGGTIGFSIRLADGLSWPWEEVDYLPNEGVVLESSVDNGSTWSTLGHYDTTGYYTWTQVLLPIPVSAQSPVTLFRWRQLSHSGSEYDHWALDNVTVDAGPTPPNIYRQPANQQVALGGTAAFSVLAAGSMPLSYQWRFNGADLPGATTSALQLANVQSNQAGFYRVRVTNDYGSALSAEAQLVMVDRSSLLAVFTDPTYVDTSGGSASEAITVQASLTNLGYFVSTFTDIDTAVTTNRLLLFPEQERRNLALDLSPATKAALADFVTQGGVLVVHGGEGGAGSLLNAVFGWSVFESAQVYSGGPTYSLTAQADGTVFAGGPYTLPCNNGTSILTNLPPEALDIYDSLGQSAVALIPYGGGVVVFLGWDWYNAYPLGTANGGWLSVLGNAVLAQGPTAPKIWTQPESQTAVVGENVRFSVAASGAIPLSYQWTFWGTNLAGVTGTSLWLTNVQFEAAGPYAVLVTNSLGSALSSNAWLTVTPPPPCTPPATGLISWWRVEGEPADQTGGNNGTLAGNAAYGPGRVGSSLVLDGSADGLLVGTAVNLQLQDFTVEAWIQRSSGSVVTYGSHGTALFFSYGSGGYGFGINNNGQLFLSRIDIDNVTLPVPITDLKFHHVAVTKTGTSLAFYIDGVAYSGYVYSSTFTFSSGAAVGARPDTMDDSFAGAIDELAVYSRALSAAEVQAIYEAGVSGKCAAPGPPAIYSQPIDQNVFGGGTARFTVGASGTAPLRYEWRFNGVPLAQATNSFLALAPANTNQSGSYTAVVTNDYGAVTSRVATLTVVSVLPGRVAILGAPATMSFNNDVLAKLTNSGAFTRVDVFYVGNGYPLPTLTDLLGYTAVLVYTDSGFPYATALGDLLANYIDNGGGVVAATFAYTSGLGLDGRFVSAGYSPLTLGSQGQGTVLNLAPDLPGHALLAGVNRFSGGSSSFHCSSVALTSGATLVAHWSNGQPLAVTKQATNGFVVALNFFPPSSDVRSDLWDATSDGARLMANALLWASQGSQPTPPTIVGQPASLTVVSGDPANFSVSAWGTQPIVYQWRFKGAPIAGATNNALVLPAAYPTNAGAYSVFLSNSVGTATSADAMLTVYVPPAPVITVSPQSQTVPAGTNVTLAVEASDSWPFTYQWYHNDAPVPGATDATLAWTDVQATNAGNYFAVVANAWNAATSAVATLTVVPAAPFFSAQPRSQAVFPGYSAVVLASAAGTEPITWQWQFYGTNIPWAINPGYGINFMQSSNTGPYRLVASNVVGQVLSDTAILALSPIAPWGVESSSFDLAVTNTVAIAAGPWHTLALRRDGRVVVWGMLDETNVPPDLTNAVAIDGGDMHSIALRADGTVVAWGGSNLNGQTNVPPDLTNAVAVAAGGAHNLVLRRDGTVLGWGLNNNGQALVPPGLSNVVAIAAGTTHSLALQAGGTVVAWGNNSSGQGAVPASLNDVVAIAAGATHNLALRRDGTLVAWGDNAYGQAIVPAGLSNVVAIAGGMYHSLAVRRDGMVVAWGAGTNNIGPYPHFGQCMIPATVSNATAVAAGGLSSLALAGDAPPFITEPPVDRFSYSGRRVVWRAAATGAWPLHYQWQLNGVDIAGATEQVLTIENATSDWSGLYRVVVSNAVGNVTSADAKLTLVDCAPLVVSQPVARPIYLGGQIQMQVGTDGSGPFTYQWRLNGVDIPGATGASLLLNHLLLSQAGNYSVVISNAFGGVSSTKTSLAVVQMAAWGAGTNYLSSPNLGQSIVPSGLGGVTGAAGGGFHTLVQKSDGRVQAWGAGTNYLSMPNLGQAIVPASLSNVVSVAGGLYHSLALKTDGTVSAWGAGTSNYVSPNYGQSIVPAGLNNAVAVAAGDFHSAALKSDGRVAIWGGGSYFTSLTNVPPTASNLVAIASRGSHIVALRNDGALVHWGNIAGAPILSNVVAIAAGQNHCLALKNDGTVTSWGSQTVVPPGLTNAVAIAAGYDFSLALRNDGTVAVWGNTNLNGLSYIPAGLTNVIGVACGNYHCLVFLGDGSPQMKFSPADVAAYLGGSATLRAGVVGAQPLRFQWQANGTNLLAGTNAVLTMNNLQAADAGAYRVIVSNVFGCVTSAVASLNVLLPLGQAVDAPNLTWTASGNTTWFGENSITHDGIDAAQSGRIGNNQSSTVQTSVSGPATLSFWWKVSSEQWFDFLTFYIDGVPQASISGEVNWQTRAFAIAAGTHTLRWTYAKDGTVNAGADAAWLDEVTYPVNPPAITLQPLSQTAAAGETVTFWAAASGSSPMTCYWLKDGNTLPDWTLAGTGASSGLTLTNVGFAHSGSYTLVATNFAGVAVSVPALLNVVAAVEQWPVPAIQLLGGTSGLFHVDYADSLSPMLNWSPLGTVEMVGASQYYFDVTLPLPSQRFYRIRRASGEGSLPALDLAGMAPALRLTGNVGDRVRVECINRFGPVEDWVTRDTLTLTNTSQLYFDASSIGQPPRLWRIVPVP